MGSRVWIVLFVVLITPLKTFGSVSISTQTLVFNDQHVGTTSAPQSVTIAFTAPDSPPQGLFASISPFNITDFSVYRSPACTPWTGLQSICTVSVVFKPITA